MRLDFTMDRYSDLCEAIVQSGYSPMTVRDYLETDRLPSRLAVVRHDVDVTPRHEQKIAQIEKGFGIRATYYFRYKRGVFRPDVMRQIASIGHEVGYHYEAMDKGKGNSQKALEVFRRFPPPEWGPEKIKEIQGRTLRKQPIPIEEREFLERYDEWVMAREYHEKNKAGKEEKKTEEEKPAPPPPPNKEEKPPEEKSP